MPHHTVLLLGDTSRSEFREARETLAAMGCVTECPNVDAAAKVLADGAAPPDVIVAAQAYPGEFSHAAIDRLRQLAPLARCVGLLGTWCEGEMRTGRPWPGVVRLYWHQTARLRQELELLARGRGSTWTLPATATDEERLLATAETPLPRRQGLVAISTVAAEMEGWLSAACRAAGYSTVWLHPRLPTRVHGVKAAIFDAAELTEAGCRNVVDRTRRVRKPHTPCAAYVRLRDLVAQLAPAPVVVLLDFPRIEDQRLAAECGAAAVLGKPVPVNELLATLP